MPTPDLDEETEPTLRQAPVLLVVGMHRSGTSAVTSALGRLGLVLPRADDLIGPSTGNEPGHFESQIMCAFADRLLAELDRSWDDPPADGEVEASLETLVRRHAEAGRATFAAAFGDEGVPAFKDPRTSVLLPFWRAVLGRPLIGIVVLRHPIEIARSLQGRDGFELPTGLALWERHLRQAIRGLEGLPVLVVSFADVVEDEAAFTTAASSFLAPLGVATGKGSLVTDRRFRHQEVSSATGGLLLPEQRALYLALEDLRGPHSCFEPPELPSSAWSDSLLRQHHELRVLWQGFEWLGRETASLLFPVLREAEGAATFPLDATEDTGRYHGWLARRGEPDHVVTSLRRDTTPTTSPPLFTVVVPTYKTPAFALERCAASVLAQVGASFELVFSDDASEDRELAGRLSELGRDPRVRLVLRKENGGISAATNAALEGANGEWVVFLDHDDELAAGALSHLSRAIEAHPTAQLIYTDEDKIDEGGRRFMPALKPDWSPDLLLSNAYMCHVLVIRRSLFERLGGLRGEFDGAQDYDLMLRATELLRDDEIVHVPEICYHWRTIAGSASGDPEAKPWAFEAGRRAVQDALERRRIEGTVSHHRLIPGSYHVTRRPRRASLVSIIVPFRDEPALLAACYRSVVEDPGEVPFELLLVDNDSTLAETRAVLAELCRDQRVRLLEAPGPFNWVKINNEAAAEADGDLLLFLNNDIEARSPAWLDRLCAQAQRDDVGAVGARLLYPDGTLQHGGVAVGVSFGAAHLQQGLPAIRPGYLSGPHITRNVSAVTGACLMTRREVFSALGGFERGMPIAFSDIDFCLRARKEGLLVVYEPLAELVHFESKSRGHSDDAAELPLFRRRWRDLIVAGDPYYNPNLGRIDSFCRLPSKEDDQRWESFLSTLDEWSTS